MNSKLNNRECKWCKKPLKVIGVQRKNGVGAFQDWEHRNLHKRCMRPYDDYIAIQTKYNLSVLF